MNLGGFSLRRLLGISAMKGRISRAIGVPLTRSGRERAVGRGLINLLRLPKVRRPGVDR